MRLLTITRCNQCGDLGTHYMDVLGDVCVCCNNSERQILDMDYPTLVPRTIPEW